MEKIWLKNYPADVPSTINPERYSTLVEMLEDACLRFANKPAFENLGQVLTFSELLQKSRQIAAYLQNNLQLKKGDRLAIMLPNLLQYPIILLAALQMGLIVVNLNPLYTERELLIPLQDSSAKVVFVLANFMNNLNNILEKTAIKHVIITEVGDELNLVKGSLVNYYLKYVKKEIPQSRLSNALKYKDIFSAHHNPFQPVEIQPTDLAFLQYTGGTTGIPKGAMLTHRNLVANILQCSAWISGALQEGEEVVITALPLYHIFSLTICCLAFMHLGALSLLITNPKNVNSFVKILKKNRFTVFVGVNTLYSALIQHKEIHSVSFCDLKLALAGGMLVTKKVAEAWERITKKPIVMGYGLTEASPVVTINPLNLTTFNTSIGLPAPSTEIAILDETGNNVPLGFPGELCVCGPQVMMGYWRQPEETQAVLLSGWLRTGDIVTIDEGGFIYLVDRKKDMILISGFNVYPSEVEEVLLTHPGVLEAAVIGVPDSELNELVKAIIVRKDVSLTKQDLLDFCQDKLSRYKLPKIIEFRNVLPKSNVGKVLKKSLRQENV